MKVLYGCLFCGWKGTEPKITWVTLCPTCEIEVYETWRLSEKLK